MTSFDDGERFCKVSHVKGWGSGRTQLGLGFSAGVVEE